MAKPSDLLGKTGATGKPTVPGASLNLTPTGKPAAKIGETQKENVTAQQPDKGHTLHKPGKAQGGGGGSSARPKV